jgi:dolichyl-phosphate-mannose--protein O-mannosyl transferase
LLFKAKAGDKKDFRIIVYFTILYCAYIGVMLTIERVMYLYHYFIPLIFSLLLAFMIFQYFFRNDMKSGDTALRNISIIFITEIICIFIFFSPFSYFIPIDSLDFLKRVWLPVWGLVPVNF